jgi:glycosyltransferase involved in cell wall biosynthesis
LNILFLPSWYPDAKNPVHALFNRRLAECIALTHRVTVLYLRSDTSTARNYECLSTVSGNLKEMIVYYRKPLFAAKLRTPARMISACRKAYASLKKDSGMPDLIHVSVAIPAGAAALYLSLKDRIPLILHEHWTGYYPEDGSYRGKLKKLLTRLVVKRAVAVLTVSRSLAIAMKEKNLAAGYYTVPNVISESLFRVPLSGISVADEVRLIHISSLDDRQKNVTGIIRAFGRAVSQNKDMRLTIAGNDDFGPYADLVKKMGLGEVVSFRGALTGNALTEALTGHHALVMFSNYESFSVIIAEALACGRPVITSRLDAINEYFTSACGISVERGDESALAAAMLRLGRELKTFDPESLREVAAQFSYERVGSVLNALYAQIL